jgi:hypothetical protein
VEILIFVGIAVIGTIIYFVNLHQAKKRLEFWQKLAHDWGFRYRSGDAYGYIQLGEHPLFQHGDTKRIEHLIEKQIDGGTMCLFDYHYKTGSGKSRQSHQVTALMLHTPLFGYGMTVRSENFMDRVAGFLGFEDINFEYEAFNRAFAVRCQDKKFAYDVFHTGMMEYLMENRGIIIEWSLTYILIYTSNKWIYTEAEARRLKSFGAGFVKRLPEYLLEQQNHG